MIASRHGLGADLQLQ